MTQNRSPRWLRRLRDQWLTPTQNRTLRRTHRPQMETLEDRTVPTIVFTPQFGPDILDSTAPFNSADNGVMSSASVYLILWGPAWSLTPTGSQSNANTIINQATAVAASTQLSILDQYGSDGKAAVKGYYIDTTTPPPGFGVATGSGFVGASYTEAEGEISTVVNAGHLPGPTGSPKLASAPIYAIITDPNDSFDGNGNVSNGGVNRNGTITSGPLNGNNINMIGVGTGNDSNFQEFAAIFTHELEEKMSEPGGRPGNPPPANYGVVVSPPSNIPPYIKDTPSDPVTNQDNWDQIADFEPEQGFTLGNGQSGYGYIYRIGGPTGVEVQAAYSDADKAFVVEDGNSEVFTLTPNWTIKANPNNDFFDGTYDLTINGDQLANKDDNITISEDSAGGIEVNLDGQIAYFDPGTSTSIGTAIRSISVNGENGSNTLTLDFSAGNFLSVMNPNNNTLANGLIQFDGGTGGTLILKGGSFTNEVDTATGPHAGSITLDGSAISYKDLLPIVDVTAAANFTINDSAASDTIHIINDAGSPRFGFQTTEVNGGGFEKVDFANKTTVTVNDKGGAGAFVVNNPAPAAGLTTMNLVATTGAGDAFTITALYPSGTTLDITGVGGSDTLTGPNVAVSWQITGTNAGSLSSGASTANFTSVPNLVGGTASDSFVFQSGGSLNSIKGGGGAGADSIQGPDFSETWNITGTNAGNIPGVLGSFTQVASLFGGAGPDTFKLSVAATIGSINGGGGSNSLDGANESDTWNITGVDAGNITGVVTSFVNIQNVLGNTIGDTFVFAVGGTMGSITGGSAPNSETIDGAGINDTWNITGSDSGSIYKNGSTPITAFQAIGDLVGGTGSDSFMFFLGANINSINGGGGAGVDTITGSNQKETWNLVGSNAGNVPGVIGSFTQVANLVGGTLPDAFLFGTGAKFHSINGGGGADVIVDGPNQTNTFNITGANAGNMAGFLTSFTNVPYLVGNGLAGNTGVDVFLFQVGGGLSGRIIGGTGKEWLDYAPGSMPVNVNLATGSASFLGLGVVNVPNVIGSGVGGDTIVGSAAGGVLEGHNAGNTIFAGSGRTVIIGGYGRNLLEGGASDDLIIAGSTIYDANIIALDAVFAEWQSAKAFATRISDLRIGASLAAGNDLILNTTVFVPPTPPGPHFGRGGGTGSSTMLGNGGENWFFTLYATTIIDLKPTDLVD
jgi:hypothetical protein